MKTKLPTAFFKELNAWINKFWPDLLFVIVLILCLWPILSIGLELLPTIKCNFNKTIIDKFNTVILNLSYSYIAGCIFYYLSVVFPRYKNKKVIKPAIKLNISKIKSIINEILVSFSSDAGEEFVSFHNLEVCKKVVMTKDWYEEVSGIKQRTGKSMSYLRFCLHEYVDISKHIESLIIKYKDYLSSEQLVLLEKIKMCSFFDLVISCSTYETILLTDLSHKDMMANSFTELIELYNKLEDTI